MAVGQAVSSSASSHGTHHTSIRRKLNVDTVSRISDVFQPFRSLLILKQTLLRRSMFRKLGCMKTLLMLKQTFLIRI